VHVRPTYIAARYLTVELERYLISCITNPRCVSRWIQLRWKRLIRAIFMSAGNLGSETTRRLCEAATVLPCYCRPEREQGPGRVGRSMAPLGTGWSPLSPTSESKHRASGDNVGWAYQPRFVERWYAINTPLSSQLTTLHRIPPCSVERKFRLGSSFQRLIIVSRYDMTRWNHCLHFGQ